MDQEKINELLELVAHALAVAQANNNNGNHVLAVRHWMLTNAPEYLNQPS